MKIVSVAMTDDLYEQIKQVAETEKRKISPTCTLLIARALKEKNRKKKKEDKSA